MVNFTSMKQALVLLVMWPLFGFAQKVELELLDYSQLEQPVEVIHDLYPINPILEFENRKPIARLKCFTKQEKKDHLATLFQVVEAKANGVMCDLYTIDSLATINETDLEIYISLYRFSEDEWKRNAASYTDNLVYVFGVPLPHGDERSIRLDGNDLTIPPMRYFVTQAKRGERVRMSMLNGLSSIVWVEYSQDRTNNYFSAGAPGLMERRVGSTFGLRVNSGKFYEMEEGLALFLAEIMQPVVDLYPHED
jgi:hypothetical protein